MKRAVKAKAVKVWALVSPDGTIHVVSDMRSECLTFAMRNRLKRPGWRVRRLRHEEMAP